ncbi:MAG: HlyC/CorC family transporter [Phycisphaerales bacterium]|nr:HlyC/CorC family transporter [Phycisphaerales bacterium]
MILLITYLAIALFVSFLCSLLEAVLLSVPRTHIAVLRDAGSSAADRLERMKEDIDQPLAAILTLNTFAHTLGAAGVGAQAAVIWGEAWVGLVSFVLTLLVLIFSEIIPKTLGAVHCKSLAPFTAVTIDWLILIFKPVVAVCNAISKLFAPKQAIPRVSREEVSNLAKLAHDEGVIDDLELKIVRNLVALREIIVEQVMTPRAVVFTYNANDTVADILAQGPSKFARVPIIQTSLDDQVGIIHRREIYAAHREGKDQTTLRELARPLHIIPETATLSKILLEFIRRQEHLFLVADEFGGSAGILTLEDTIETLIGAEIVDETDDEVDMRELAKRMINAHQEHHPRTNTQESAEDTKDKQTPQE